MRLIIKKVLQSVMRSLLDFLFFLLCLLGHQENRTLSLEAAHFKKDADHLFFENVKLKHRASVAEGLINSIQPPMPTNRDGLGALDEEEATRREVEILKEDAKEMKKWDEACKTLGINQDALFRIQKDIMER